MHLSEALIFTQEHCPHMTSTFKFLPSKVLLGGHNRGTEPTSLRWRHCSRQSASDRPSLLRLQFSWRGNLHVSSRTNKRRSIIKKDGFKASFSSFQDVRIELTQKVQAGDDVFPQSNRGNWNACVTVPQQTIEFLLFVHLRNSEGPSETMPWYGYM